jgi:uncharacterized membrane protein
MRWGRTAALTGLATAFYLVLALRHAQRPLWFDEIVTFHVASLPTAGAIWRAVLTGIELSPPLWFVVSRLSFAVLGASELALRAPSMVAFWACAVCVFMFVARRCGNCWAAAAVGLLMLSRAMYYAAEGRTYALLLACTAAACVCWQRLDVRGGRVAVPALAALLLLVPSIHYFGVFVLVPFGLASLVRMRRRGRPDWRLVGCLLLPPVSLLAYLPHLRVIAGMAPTYWARPTVQNLAFTYAEQMYAIVPLLLPLLPLLLVLSLTSRRASAARAASFPVDELVLVAALAALPVIEVALTRLTINSFASRYALPGVLGVVILAAVLGDRLTAGSRLAAWTVALTCLVGVVTVEIEPLEGREQRVPTELPERVAAHPEEAIVIGDPGAFLETWQYARADVKARLTFLVDREGAVAGRGWDTSDHVLDCLSHVVPIAVVQWQSRINAGSRFFFVGGPDEHILTRCRNAGARVLCRGPWLGTVVYEVVVPHFGSPQPGDRQREAGTVS